MPLLNVEEETEVIRNLLETGFFTRDRSTNSAEDYAASEEIQLLWENGGRLVNAN